MLKGEEFIEIATRWKKDDGYQPIYFLVLSVFYEFFIRNKHDRVRKITSKSNMVVVEVI